MIKNLQKVKILAIETSCDETSAAIVEGRKSGNKIEANILSNIVASQVKLHQKYGGVYPEMASRAHVQKIIPVIERALNVGGTDPTSSRLRGINAIAVTSGPGLIGSLLVGVYAAKTLAYVFKKPLIPVNHIEGHIYSNFVGEIRNPKSEILNHRQGGIPLRRDKSQYSNSKFQTPEFPLVALTVAGGHTTLVLMKNHLSYQILGETVDDAAGEAFDKVARLLGLGYPGGPQIEQTAARFEVKNQKLKVKSSSQKSKIIELPRPMINSKDFNFSFSGLKTAVMREVKSQKSKVKSEAIAVEFQEAVTDVLVQKTLKAAQKNKVKSVLLGGGVAANKRLRQKMQEQIEKYTNAQLFIAPLDLCGDNAAMIGTAAVYRFLLKKGVKNWYDVDAKANLHLG